VKIVSSSELEKALANAQIAISFTSPDAEVQNVPKIAAMKRDFVIGTTGMNEDQLAKVRTAIATNGVSAVIAANFSPLVNVQINPAKKAASLLAPLGYEFGIVEEHHSAKKDAPSGTAKKIIAAVGGARIAPQNISALRLGGTPGQHELRIVGAHGRLTLESLMYSRADFAKGALEAALWLQKNRKPGKIFGMEDILNLR